MIPQADQARKEFGVPQPACTIPQPTAGRKAWNPRRLRDARPTKEPFNEEGGPVNGDGTGGTRRRFVPYDERNQSRYEALYRKAKESAREKVKRIGDETSKRLRGSLQSNLYFATLPVRGPLPGVEAVRAAARKLDRALALLSRQLRMRGVKGVVFKAGGWTPDGKQPTRLHVHMILGRAVRLPMRWFRRFVRRVLGVGAHIRRLYRLWPEGGEILWKDLDESGRAVALQETVVYGLRQVLQAEAFDGPWKRRFERFSGPPWLR